MSGDAARKVRAPHTSGDFQSQPILTGFEDPTEEFAGVAYTEMKEPSADLLFIPTYVV
jgi:hypothetical protein